MGTLPRVRMEWREDGGALASGSLPEGATHAIVIDRTGGEHRAAAVGGAWQVTLHEPPGFEPPVARFVDDAGRIVRPPVPRGTPVDDAPTPCPACGATRWTATAELVACEVCGHGEELPAVVEVSEVE